jgi:hypothetical protein
MRFRTEDMLKSELAALPELTPPPEIEARVLEAMRAAAEARPMRHSRRPALLGAALAAAAAFAAALFLFQPRTGPAERPAQLAVDSTPVQIPLDNYVALVEQSAELERALFALPAPRAVMRAGTASTIASLEDRIAQIDQELTFATAAGVEGQGRAALWRDRVEVMNALVQVRYANSRAFVY